MSLIDVLTLQAIQKLADERTFERGKAYFHDGAVGLLDADEQEVRASVQGTQRYRVRLSARSDDELEYECDCPVGDDGTFCKHAVAVALSWLENAGEEVFVPSDSKSARSRKKRKTHEEQIREYLETLSEGALREWLMEAADRDRGIRDKLLFAAKAKGAGDVSSLKSVVRQATRVSDFVDWRHAGDYAQRLADLAQMLEQRIADGDPKLVEIIEQAIAQAEDALGHIDDSDGSVMPTIMQLRAVHERACNDLKADPVALAERLFRFQTTGDWDTFHSVLPAYERALGQSGLRRYRELVETAWKRLPALGPEASRTHFDVDRFRIEHAMEELAELSGDVDALVAVKSHNLSNPHAFLELAEVLKRHGRHDEALTWAEKGIASFGGERLDDLVKFCIDEHLRRGDANLVESLAWQRFVRQPGSDSYFELVSIGKRIERADDLVARALHHLWQLVRAEEAPNAKRLPSWQPPIRSALVAVHLRQKDAVKAWEAFCGGPVDMRLWDKVAAMRGKTHPEEAVMLYKQLLPHVVSGGTRGAQYGEAFEIVKAIWELRAAQRKDAVFKQELDEVRMTWKAKRNFIKLLATLG
ncbi:MAG: SWIM zinc finger family protein [Pseudomonadota bacterium]|nr:SWIM zinc finger family protein [Pseudomonadota bacterium]